MSQLCLDLFTMSLEVNHQPPLNKWWFLLDDNKPTIKSGQVTSRDVLVIYLLCQSMLIGEPQGFLESSCLKHGKKQASCLAVVFFADHRCEQISMEQNQLLGCAWNLGCTQIRGLTSQSKGL